MKTGLLLAEMCLGRVVRTSRLIQQGRVDVHGKLWLRIRLSKNRMVTCDCGGAVQDDPNTGRPSNRGSGCSHIDRMYNHADVTEDPGLASFEPSAWHVPTLLIRFTERGRLMFYPRWVAMALK